MIVSRMSDVVVLVGLMFCLLFGVTDKVIPQQIQLIPSSANRALMLMPHNVREIKENSVLADVVLTNLTGTWFQAEIEFNPLRKNVAVTEKQIPYVFLMGPYQQKTFKDIEFFEGQALWFNVYRDIKEAPAAFAMLAIDMICRGIFSKAFTPEEFNELLSNVTIEGFKAAGETLGNDTAGSLIACIAALSHGDLGEAGISFADFVFSTKKFKKQLWQIVKSIWGEKNSILHTIEGVELLTSLIEVISFREKAVVVEQLAVPTFEASWNDIVWLTARKKSEKRPIIELVNPLQIMPYFPVYYLGETLHAKFGINNNSASAIKLKQLVVGGRGPDGKDDVQNFSPATDVTIAPTTCYQYKGSLKLTKPGEYHFFCAYQESNGQWHPSIDLGPGLTDTDRIQNIKVSQLTASASFKTGDKVKVISQLGLWLRSLPEVINEEPANKIISKPMPLNTELIIVSHSDNGIASDGYYWWLVQYKEQQGWCAEANYRRTDVFLSLIPMVIPPGKPGKPQHIDS